MTLAIEHLSFAYGEKQIFSDLNLRVGTGECVALLGVSGSGKTTLFRLITGLMQPDRGRISAPQTTYMRQEDLLLPWRTIEENLRLYGELGKDPHPPSQREIEAMLDRVGLAGYGARFPEELSGGMRQRVALARALLQRHPLMLLDEPFASLDVIVREQLYHLLREICHSDQKTLLFVTHDFRDALALADRICVLSEGSIGAVFTPEAKNTTAIRDALAATL